jgi:uncharacterized protein (DUF433 family)
MSDIVMTEGVMGGQPRIEGRRISVLEITEWVREESMTPEAVSAEFDLDLADVYRALAYYYDNTAEMDTWRDRRRHRIEDSREAAASPNSTVEMT